MKHLEHLRPLTCRDVLDVCRSNGCVLGMVIMNCDRFIKTCFTYDVAPCDVYSVLQDECW